MKKSRRQCKTIDPLSMKASWNLISSKFSLGGGRPMTIGTCSTGRLELQAEHCSSKQEAVKWDRIKYTVAKKKQKNRQLQVVTTTRRLIPWRVEGGCSYLTATAGGGAA
jgi:hypothetical protein